MRSRYERGGRIVEKGTWFQLHPDRVLLQINRIPDATLRGDALIIGLHALTEGGLSKEAVDIAWATGLAEERIKQLMPYLLRMQDSEWEDGLMPGFAADMVREQEEYRNQKALAGKRSAERRKQTEPEPGPAPETPLPETNDVPPPEKPPTAFNSVEQRSTTFNDAQPNRQTDKQTDNSKKGGTRARESSPIRDSLEEILPGLAVDFQAGDKAVRWAMDFKATPEQIKAFPAWMARNLPKVALNHWAFRDHFTKSLKGDLPKPEDEKRKADAMIGASESHRKLVVESPPEPVAKEKPPRKGAYARVLEILAKSLDDAAILSWFEPLTEDRVENGVLFLSAPGEMGQMFKDYILFNHAEEFSVAITKAGLVKAEFLGAIEVAEAETEAA
jgi:hypothetical protein